MLAVHSCWIPAWRGSDIHSSLTLSYQPLDERLMNPLRLRIAMQQGSCISTVRCILIARRVGTRDWNRGRP